MAFQRVAVLACDVPLCGQEARKSEAKGWGRWRRDGRSVPLDVCPEHDRELGRMFAVQLASVPAPRSSETIKPHAGARRRAG